MRDWRIVLVHVAGNECGVGAAPLPCVSVPHDRPIIPSLAWKHSAGADECWVAVAQPHAVSRPRWSARPALKRYSPSTVEALEIDRLGSLKNEPKNEPIVRRKPSGSFCFNTSSEPIMSVPMSTSPTVPCSDAHAKPRSKHRAAWMAIPLQIAAFLYQSGMDNYIYITTLAVNILGINQGAAMESTHGGAGLARDAVVQAVNKSYGRDQPV